jgi:hypothetical protein
LNDASLGFAHVQQAVIKAGKSTESFLAASRERVLVPLNKKPVR